MKHLKMQGIPTIFYVWFGFFVLRINFKFA